MMRALLLLALLLPAACAQPGAEAPGALATLARLPAELPGARRVAPPAPDPMSDVTDGAFIRYGMPFGATTIHLYRRAQPVPPGPDSALARQELASSTAAVIVVQATRAAGGAVALVAQPEFGVQAAGSPAFRCTEMLRLVAGQATPGAHEYVCLTGAADAFLKLRITLTPPAATDPQRLRAYVGRLAAAVGRSVTGGAAPEAAPPADVPPGEKPPPLPAGGPLIRT